MRSSSRSMMRVTKFPSHPAATAAIAVTTRIATGTWSRSMGHWNMNATTEKRPLLTPNGPIRANAPTHTHGSGNGNGNNASMRSSSEGAREPSLNFDDVTESFAVKSTYELIRALAVFKACSYPWYDTYDMMT